MFKVQPAYTCARNIYTSKGVPVALRLYIYTVARSGIQGSIFGGVTVPEACLYWLFVFPPLSLSFSLSRTVYRSRESRGRRDEKESAFSRILIIRSFVGERRKIIIRSGLARLVARGEFRLIWDWIFFWSYTRSLYCLRVKLVYIIKFCDREQFTRSAHKLLSLGSGLHRKTAIPRGLHSLAYMCNIKRRIVNRRVEKTRHAIACGKLSVRATYIYRTPESKRVRERSADETRFSLRFSYNNI